MSAAALLVLAGLTACSSDDPMPHEAVVAVAHVAEAVSMYEADGLEATLAHYDDPESIDGEFYVVLLSEDGVVLNHPYRPDLTGTAAAATTTDDGRPVGEAILASTSSGSPAWVSFNFNNPVDDAIERKHVWAVRHDGYIFASGYYEPLN